jgi:hypothetical protein
VSEHDPRVKELLNRDLKHFILSAPKHTNTLASCCGTRIFDKEGILNSLDCDLRQNIETFLKVYGRKPSLSGNSTKYLPVTKGFYGGYTEPHLAECTVWTCLEREENTGVASIMVFRDCTDEEVKNLVPKMDTYNIHKYQTLNGAITILWRDC